jgi:hypothetical protein
MQLKHTFVALAAAGLLSTQAYAGEAQIEAAIPPAQPAAAFTEIDMQALFGQDAEPMQLAALSPQEMRETEGAWWLNAAGAFVGGFSGAYGFMTEAAFSRQGPRNVGWGLTRSIVTGAALGAINPARSIGGAFGRLSGSVAQGYGNALISNRGWRF